MDLYSNSYRILCFWFVSMIIIVNGLTNVNADCDVWVSSAAGNPVANVTVTYRNISDNTTLSTNTTGITGRSVHSGNCINVSITTDYPSSSYTALLRNASVISEANINDWVTARIQVMNTLGQFLEGQDCSVSVYENTTENSTALIHDYETLCTIGEPYVDDSGNWVSPTECKFTDSRGWYYFKGKIDESMGYEYNKYYNLIFVCNGEVEIVTFLTTLDKQPDVTKFEAFMQKQGGYIVLAILGALLILIVVVAIIIMWHEAKKKQ